MTRAFENNRRNAIFIISLDPLEKGAASALKRVFTKVRASRIEQSNVRVERAPGDEFFAGNRTKAHF